MKFTTKEKIVAFGFFLIGISNLPIIIGLITRKAYVLIPSIILSLVGLLLFNSSKEARAYFENKRRRRFSDKNRTILAIILVILYSLIIIAVLFIFMPTVQALIFSGVAVVIVSLVFSVTLHITKAEENKEGESTLD